MLPLHLIDDHPYLELDGALWLFDTGAPTSFGSADSVELAGETCSIASSYLGMTVATLDEHLSTDCAGLLGADVLGRFDFLLDLEKGEAEVSTGTLLHPGVAIPLDQFMGIPIVTARIAGRERRMFFDTGAQVSFFQHESLADFPPAGEIEDFYPGFGEFRSGTHTVELELGLAVHQLRCGTLPGLLGMTLMMAGVEGIVGNEIVRGRSCGYFPRRGTLEI